MRGESILILGMLIILFKVNAQNENKKMIYRNDEIEISFPGSYAVSDERVVFNSPYFSQYTSRIEFCWHVPGEGQTIMYEGYLCNMYILPLIDDEELFEELKKNLDPKSQVSTVSEVVKVKLGNNYVFKWRIRNGKSRYDHYLVKARNHSYLFVSSPYGGRGAVEDIVAGIHLLK